MVPLVVEYDRPPIKIFLHGQKRYNSYKSDMKYNTKETGQAGSHVILKIQ